MEKEILLKDLCLILSTLPARDCAEKIAETLVGEKLAACASVGSPSRSFYMWEGKLHSDVEFPLEIKTVPAKLDSALQRLKNLHPYECPQIIVLDAWASQQYVDWAADCAGGVQL